MKTNLLRLILLLISINIFGCELNPSMHGGLGVGIEIPIRINSSIAREHFPALKATKERNFMIDCIADKKDKNIINKKCHAALDYYQQKCFKNPSGNSSCSALFNVASMTNNTLILRKLNNKTNGLYPKNPVTSADGKIYFINIK